MIKYRIGKGAGHMADAAVLRGRDMTGMLLDCRPRSIITVALCAVIHDTGMIENAILEIGANTMTDAAILAVCGRMIRRHASGAGEHIVRTTIVARSAVAGDPRMAEN